MSRQYDFILAALEENTANTEHIFSQLTVVLAAQNLKTFCVAILICFAKEIGKK
jgi:hypothetical protein